MDLSNQKTWLGLLVAGIIYTILNMYLEGSVLGLATGYLGWIVGIIYFAIVFVIVTYIYEALGKK